MSFGFSISDFLAIIEITNRTRSRFVDAPDQFKAVSNEVKSLSNVLRNIDDVLPQRDVSNQQKARLEEIVQGCKDVLRELEDLLDKYQELDLNTSGFGQRSRRVWKRLRWDQKAIDGLRSRITLHILSFNSFLEQISNQTIFATKEGIDRLVNNQDDQDRQAILDWLTPVDYATQQSDFISRRQPSTGTWLLKSEQFRTWVDLNSATLFCPGIPGAGKTMSAALVIDELLSRFQDSASFNVSYVYCNFRRQHEQRVVDLLASLLRQMIRGLQPVPINIKQLHEQCQRKRIRPSIEEISQALHSTVGRYSKVFIIVDALDECQVSDGARKQLLTELFNLQARTLTNLFITSRFTPEIERALEERSTKLEIRATNEDLKIYIDGNMVKLPSFVSRRADLREETKTAIVNAADGMFLLAQLHLDSLVGQPSPKAFKNALKTLPTGSDGYDKAYYEAMDRIKGQVTVSYELAKRVLSWITCAKRPLTTLELQHALAVEMDELELDHDNLPDVEEMISVCAGLVTVDEDSNIIRLVHYTTQEFFNRTRAIFFPSSETDIASVCITYLSFDTFGSGCCRSDNDLDTRLKSNPLYDYAAQNWAYHLHCSDEKYPDAGFLTNDLKASACSQAFVHSEAPWSSHSQNAPNNATGLHLAARFGLTELVALLLENGQNPNCRNSYGETPLSLAAKNGHRAVVQLLVERDDVEADSKTKFGQTPLSLAAKNGHKAVVQLLVERDDVEADSKDTYGQTPLSLAAENGHQAVVQLLVERDDVEADSKDTYGQTPLSQAALHGQEAVVQLLIERDDVEIDPKDDRGHTPLLWAAHYGHEAVVQLLIDRDDVDIDSKDYRGKTPLWWAAQRGHEAVVQLLIDRDDVDIDSKDDRDHTPLWWATKNEHQAVRRLLVGRLERR